MAIGRNRANRFLCQFQGTRLWFQLLFSLLGKINYDVFMETDVSDFFSFPGVSSDKREGRYGRWRQGWIFRYLSELHGDMYALA